MRGFPKRRGVAIQGYYRLFYQDYTHGWRNERTYGFAFSFLVKKLGDFFKKFPEFFKITPSNFELTLTIV